MSKPFRASKTSGYVGLVLLALAGAVFVYWRVGVERQPGEYEVRKGNYRLEDGFSGDAIREFTAALTENPDNLPAMHGLGVAYLQKGELNEAVRWFNTTLEKDSAYAVAYADRGITLDRMGRHEEALDDYKAALKLNPKLAEGPGWLWRFLRNISEKPPTIADRARYIEEELKKPPGERLLRLPEVDDEQQMYKK